MLNQRDFRLALRMYARLRRLARQYETMSMDAILLNAGADCASQKLPWREAEQIRAVSSFIVYRFPEARLGNCLKLSLLRFGPLRAIGHPVTFHMGVKMSDQGLTGHAWLCLNQQPLWEPALMIHSFRETYRYPRFSTANQVTELPTAG